MKVNDFTIEDAKEVVKAWESLKGNKYYSAKDVENWLIHDMAPVINKLRDKIKNHEKKTNNG